MHLWTTGYYSHRSPVTKAWFSGLAVALSVGAATGASGNGGTQSASDRVASALDTYARGAYVEGLAALRGKAPLRDTVRDFREYAPRWVDADPILQARRRTVAMAVTVELVRLGVAGRVDEYLAARPLIEWMCTAVRTRPPTDAERLFHLATVGLLQGAADEMTLLGFGVQEGRSGHLFHAAERFPFEPRLKLALMLTRPGMLAIGTRPLGRQVAYASMTLRHLNLDAGHQTGVLRDTFDRLEMLVREPAIEYEVVLRRGVLRFMTGAPDAAPDFQHAAGSDEPFVRYLAHLMLGIVYERSGEPRSAIGAYSLAVRATPGTAASMALASLLFREGQTDEAARVADEWARGPRIDDPWRQFEFGDYRLVPEVLSVLRSAR